MAQKYLTVRGKRFYKAAEYKSKRGAEEYKAVQRRYGVLVVVRKNGNYYCVYAPYSAKDVIYVGKRKQLNLHYGMIPVRGLK